MGLAHKQQLSKTLTTRGHPNGRLQRVCQKGSHSVGVARQYCGRLGKVDNCQSGVFIGYASPTAMG